MLARRRGRALGGPQPQDVAVEQIELAGIGLEKAPRRLGNGGIEAVDVEGLEAEVVAGSHRSAQERLQAREQSPRCVFYWRLPAWHP